VIDRERLVKTFCDLARIDSPSGEEEAIAVELVGRLEALGLEVRRDSYGNIIAGDGRSGPLILSAHIDTVEPGRGVSPTVEGERIVSDGSTILGGDCKAGVAAILEALESVREDGTPHAAVEVAFTREEEIGLVGARNLDFSMLSGKEAIVFDGEGPPSQITSSSPTYVGFDIEITGRAAHAGVEPEKGISAIRIASEIITRFPQGRLDDETTFNVGTIEGGTVRNAVPESTTVLGEFRSRNLESLDGVRLQLLEAVGQVRRMFPEATIEEHLHTEFETYTLTDDDPATGRVKAALRELGLTPAMHPSGGGTDGNVFRLNGISAVVVGMADHNMHTVREYVTIPDLVDAAHLCETLLTQGLAQ
jgi:tripeptide aminopeptidase